MNGVQCSVKMNSPETFPSTNIAQHRHPDSPSPLAYLYKPTANEPRITHAIPTLNYYCTPRIMQR